MGDGLQTARLQTLDFFFGECWCGVHGKAGFETRLG